ncbi:TPA: phosphoethanolamine transferase, partial [Salmonella enterica subsp. enterica serovar Chester]
IFSIISMISYLRFGDMTTSMVMASVGVGLYAILGTLKSLGWPVISLFILSCVVVIFISFYTPIAKYSIAKKYSMIILLIIFLIIPMTDGIKSWGWRFYFNNLRYSPSFISQDYLNNFKIFFGYMISLGSIYTENYQNNFLYRRVAHNTLPSWLSIEDKGGNKEQNIIYIIGESSNPGRYSIYGYKNNTTPNLSDLLSNKKICAINKVHSPAGQTRLAVPMLTSLETPDDRKALFHQPNLIEIAQMQGYKTYWLDTQTQFNLWDKPFGFISQYADVLASPDRQNTAIKIKNDNDKDLLKAVKKYISSSNNKEKNFFVIHLIGQHLPYNGFIESKALNNKYDNSIYSTDYLINEIKKFADKHLNQYVLIYVSDHGEVVGVGHGYTTPYNEFYKIPLIFSQSRYCNEIEHFRDDNGYISSNTIKYLILNMMGVNVASDKIKTEIQRSDIVLNSQEQKVNFSSLIDIPMPYEQKEE